MTIPLRHPRRGFVLMMVLGVLVVVSLILARIAQQGVVMSVRARERSQGLQAEYARISCERALLAKARSVFDRVDDAKGPGEPVVTLTDALSLGEIRVDLALADESSKLNVNQVFGLKGLVSTDRLLKRIVPPRGGVHQRLRPDLSSPVAFSSWGQMYAFRSSQPANTRSFVWAASERLTCWGEPLLNFQRCRPETLVALLELVAPTPQATDLATRLVENRPANLQAALVAAEVPSAERDRIAPLLAEQSTTFSLRVRTASSMGQATSVAIATWPANNEDDGEIPRLQRFMLP